MDSLTIEKLNLLTEANQLTARLLIVQQKEMDLCNELYPSFGFDAWVMQMGQVNRINRIVDKAVQRAKRRALFFTQSDDKVHQQKIAA